MDTIGDKFAAALRAALAGAIEDEKATLGDIAKMASSTFNDTPGSSGGANLGNLLGFGFIASLISLAAADIEDPLNAIAGAAGDTGTQYGIGYMLGTVLWEIFQPVIRPIIHAAEAAVTTQTADPQTGATWEATGITQPNSGESDAAGYGWGSGYYAAYLEAALNYPELGMLFQLLNLEAFGPDTLPNVEKALKRHGIPDDWAGVITLLARQRLAPDELALAVLRGNMSQADGETYAQLLGMINQDFDLMVQNTGEPPGLMQMIEMWRRGILPKTDADPSAPSLENGIRYSRVRSDWIPFIEQLQFEPMTTVDAVRAVVENQMTQEAGEAIAAQNGLAAADFDTLVRSWGRPPSHEQMMKAYRLGVTGPNGTPVTLDDVGQAVRESDIKDKYVQTVIGIERQVIPQRTIVMMLEHGAITADQAMVKLAEDGYTPDDAALIIKLGTVSRTTTQKHLTRTDIILLYENAAMSRDQAADALVKLGYTAQDAADVLQVADVKVAASLRAKQVTQLHTAWKAHKFTDPQVLDMLQAVGLDRTQAENTLGSWGLTLGTPSKQLTEAQIVKATEAGLITLQDGLQRLVNLGYAFEDAQILLTLAGFNAGLTPPLTS